MTRSERGQHDRRRPAVSPWLVAARVRRAMRGGAAASCPFGILCRQDGGVLVRAFVSLPFWPWCQAFSLPPRRRRRVPWKPGLRHFLRRRSASPQLGRSHRRRTGRPGRDRRLDVWADRAEPSRGRRAGRRGDGCHRRGVRAGVRRLLERPRLAAPARHDDRHLGALEVEPGEVAELYGPARSGTFGPGQVEEVRVGSVVAYASGAVGAAVAWRVDGRWAKFAHLLVEVDGRWLVAAEAPPR